MNTDKNDEISQRIDAVLKQFRQVDDSKLTTLLLNDFAKYWLCGQSPYSLFDVKLNTYEIFTGLLADYVEREDRINALPELKAIMTENPRLVEFCQKTILRYDQQHSEVCNHILLLQPLFQAKEKAPQAFRRWLHSHPQHAKTFHQLEIKIEKNIVMHVSDDKQQGYYDILRRHYKLLRDMILDPYTEQCHIDQTLLVHPALTTAIYDLLPALQCVAKNWQQSRLDAQLETKLSIRLPLRFEALNKRPQQHNQTDQSTTPEKSDSPLEPQMSL